LIRLLLLLPLFLLAATSPACESRTGSEVMAAQAFSDGLVSVRLMSYNVLWGGGLDRRFDANYLAWQHPIFDGRDRFEAIMAVIERADPDVLAVQEAAGWDEGKPSVAQRVAARLGMQYVLVKNPYNINVALFSKLPIVSSLDLVPQMGSNAALIATLQAPDGAPIYVAAAHLDPFTSRMRECQVGLLLAALEPVRGQRVVLMGDMNFRPTANAFRLLQDEGWTNLAVAESLPIDQVWLGPGTDGWTAQPLWPPGSIEANLSDHYPVGVRIDFGEGRPQATPAKLAAPGPEKACSPG
jgi:endonuclease/exonuclease/phosphatase family metal-dependent hydrolase